MVLSADADRPRTRFDSRVPDVTVVRSEMWPASRDDIVAEPARHGFTPVREAGDPAVPTVRPA